MDNKFDDYFDSIPVPDDIDTAIKNGINEANKKKHRKALFLRTAAAAASVLFIIFAFSIRVNLNSNINKNEAINKTTLPIIGSVEKLNKLIDKNNIGNYGMSTGTKSVMVENAKSGVNPNNKSSDYSNTNLQVQGVDEDDTVKTDGQYIFCANQNKVNIVEALPANNMKSINSITVDDKYHNVRGIYISKDYMIVISGFQEVLAFKGAINSSNKQVDVNINNNSETKITIYDIKNITEIKKVREVSFGGNYITSRMIDSKLYLITNKYISYDYENNKVTGSDLPYYKDSLKNNANVTIDLNNTPYLPDSPASSFICIGTLDISSLNKDIAFSAFLGSSNCIYASKNNLYIASNGYNDSILTKKNSFTANTKIYKFSFNNDNIKYVGKAGISGTVLNQFSMDESNDYLRVTSTESSFTSNGISQTNNIFVFDKDMKQVGMLNNIEQGERIYATRFMGDKAYVVTYKNTDPLLVIDLNNPASPKVLGELKIPGYSTYLQTYDDNHLIGIGMNTTENNNIAKTDGVKLSLYDISNLSAPKEVSTVKIDADSSTSEALYNHKAFLFSKDKNLIAFPVSESSKNNSSFVGAYVYNISLSNGITYKGKITHSNDNTEDGNSANSYDAQINRIIYIDDNLYTVSQSEIKSNKISDLSELSTVKFK